MNNLHLNLDNALNEARQKGFYLTKFLNLEEASYLKERTKAPLKLYFNGGFEDAERVRAFISDDIEPYFGIKILKASIDSHFRTVSHRHVLGTIMGLGLAREMIGDIVVEDDAIYIFVVDSIASFLIENLTEINRVGLKFSEVDDFIPPVDAYKSTVINVASLRIDAVISKACNMSRDDAKAVINEGLVFINQKQIKKPDLELNLGDLISVRHFGRIELVQIKGKSKKDRLNLEVVIKK